MAANALQNYDVDRTLEPLEMMVVAEDASSALPTSHR
jgi:hypothetical protein